MGHIPHSGAGASLSHNLLFFCLLWGGGLGPCTSTVISNSLLTWATLSPPGRLTQETISWRVSILMSKKWPKSAVLAGKITGWMRFDVMLFILKTTSKLVRDASMRKLTKNFTWQPWPCISQTQWNWNISVYSPQFKAYRKIFAVMCTKNCWVGSTFYFNTHFCQSVCPPLSVCLSSPVCPSVLTCLFRPVCLLYYMPLYLIIRVGKVTLEM